uniref:Competence protein ComEC n=1 Tax=Candidatus Kentrum sp. MB TaxID=2138164 RepID=A0A450XP78_9GAMM|nr:MAG: competence protein ComEC [Candidatus Kentron sp. MB]
MGIGAVAFLSGIVCLCFFPVLPDAFFVGLLPALLLWGLFSSSRMVRMAAWFGVGFLWALFRAEIGLSNLLPVELEGLDLTLEGVIAEIPKERKLKTTFLLDVREVEPLDDSAPMEWGRGQRIRLNWYQNAPRLLPGELWHLTVRLKRPRGFRNPGGFDYERWLFQQGVNATGYVRPEPGNRRIARKDGISLTRARHGLARLIEESLPDSSYDGIVKALAIGVREGVTEEQWRILRETGTAHLMAISGLHIGLVTTLIFFVVRWMLPAGLMLAAPAQRVAALAALAGAFGYAALAGFSLPTQRALVMVCVVMAGILARRHISVGNSLALALLAVLALEPFAVLSMGFWLSFAAVAVILLGMRGHLSMRGLWWRWGRVQFVVAIGILPLTLLFFHQHPLIGPVANLAIPWVGFVVVPLVVAGTCLIGVFPDFGGMLLQGGNSAIAAMWPFLESLASLDLVYRQAFFPPIWSVATGAVGMVLLLLPRGFPGRWLGVVWLLPLFLATPARPGIGEIWFDLLDVGQGLSAVLRTREHVLVYDVGPSYGAGFDAGQGIIAPFLRDRGVRSVDRVLISHRDRDHVGGLRGLLTEFPVDMLMMNGPSVEQPIKNAVGESAPPNPKRVMPCRAGMAWRWDGVYFQVLHPPRGKGAIGNNGSCVLKVSNGNGAILLPGDIERSTERRLVRAHQGKLGADILVVPHHGSRTSSGAMFIEAVRPRYALFSSGYRNRFDLPADKVVTRYQRSGARLLFSARHGAIGFRLMPEKEISGPTLYRETARRFWHR